MPARLSVSRRAPLSCEEVARALAEAGIGSSASPNFSAVDGRVEYGCGVRVQRARDLLPAWDALRDRFGFDCAHVQSSKFAGCVLDYAAMKRRTK